MSHIDLVPLPTGMEKDASALRTAFNYVKAPFVGLSDDVIKASPKLENWMQRSIHRGSGIERGAYNRAAGLREGEQGFIKSRQAMEAERRGAAAAEAKARSLEQSRIKNYGQDVAGQVQRTEQASAKAVEQAQGNVSALYERVQAAQAAGQDTTALLAELKRAEAAVATAKQVGKSQVKGVLRGNTTLRQRIGQQSGYYARRAADVLTQKGQFQSIPERLLYGRLGAGLYMGHAPVLGARALQGGLFGKGGIVRGALAVDPRVGMRYQGLRSALQDGRKLDAAREGLGLAGRSLQQAGKVGLIGGMPIAAVGSALAYGPEAGSGRTYLGNVGHAVGEGIGTLATWPMGMLTWGIVPGTEALNPSKYLASAGESLGNLVGTKADTPAGPPLPSTYDYYEQYPDQRRFVDEYGRYVRPYQQYSGR
tara:strand:- start:9064 stop:10332 length:1269 start_codon:yes stop_codon:yes gene_type:complete